MGGEAEAAGCFYCPCNQTYFSDIGVCNANCHVSLGCFTGICAVPKETGLPGRAATEEEDANQRDWFPNLACYSVTADPTDNYNCIALSAGITNDWVWKVVDRVYGNNDGKVDVSDFDSFYTDFGYSVSASCSQEAGKQKIALYGQPDGSGNWEPTHAARQAP
jgi:hypothetical protein